MADPKPKLSKLWPARMRNHMLDAFARARERLRGYSRNELLSFGLNRYRIAAGEKPVLIDTRRQRPQRSTCCLCNRPAREILETIHGQPQPLCGEHLREFEI